MTLMRIASLIVLVSTVSTTSYVELSKIEEFRRFLAEHHKMSFLRDDLMAITGECNSLMRQFNQHKLNHSSYDADESEKKIQSRIEVIMGFHSTTTSVVLSGNSSQLSELAMNLVVNNRGGIEHYFDSKHAGEGTHGLGEEQREKNFMNLFWPQKHGVNDELLGLTRNITNMMLANANTHAKVLRIMKSRFLLKKKVVSVFAETMGNSKVLIESHQFFRTTWDEMEKDLTGDVKVMQVVVEQEITSMLLLGEKRHSVPDHNDSSEATEAIPTPVHEYPIQPDVFAKLRRKFGKFYMNEKQKMVIRHFIVSMIAILTCAAVTLSILALMTRRSRVVYGDNVPLEKRGYSMLKD